jgi:hypothetical protein
MAENREIDINQVMSAMDSTQLSIRDTLGELKDRVQESADWKHQVSRRPIVSLWVAVAFGVALSRLLIPLVGRARRLSPSPKAGRGRALAAASGAVALLAELAALAPLVRQARPLVRQARRVIGLFDSRPRSS